MSEINVLFGAYFEDESAHIVKILCNRLKKEMIDSGVAVAGIDAVKSKQQIEESLESGKYSLLICSELLGEEGIGVGALRRWEQRFPKIKIILSVAPERKGGEKLVKFLNNVPYFYNVIFKNELSGDAVAKLIMKPRTREEAIEYYGVGHRSELKGAQQEAAVVVQEVSEKKEEISEENLPIIMEDENSKADAAESAPGVTESELEKLAESFADMEEEMTSVEESEEQELDVQEEKNHEAGFDYSAMFGGDLFGSSEESLLDVEVTEIEDESDDGEDTDEFLEELKEMEQVVIEKSERSKRNETNSKGVPDTESFGLVSINKGGIKFPDSGKILRVFDYNTMLLGFAEEFVLASEEMLDDYKMLLVVKGTRGSRVNGRYKVGVQSFEGYLGDRLGERAVIVEVPNFDLVEHDVESKECSLIFMKQ